MLRIIRRRTVIVTGAVLFSLLLAVVACAGPTSTPAPTQAQPSVRADLQIAELAIDPAEVNPGEEVVITAKVTNFGDATGIYPVQLGINGTAALLKNVTVPPGATQTFSFLVSKDIPGTYEVALGGLAGQFVVAESVGLTQPTGNGVTAPEPAASSCCGSTGSSCGCGGAAPSSPVPPQRTGCGCR
ncbi:MAG: hypothetical protein H8D32_03495 [Dehalococcoidia bacterium]|nr:hypothetical protein [Dehalococcoidia bacterium]